jgi:diamine N-acetyltransferase
VRPASSPIVSRSERPVTTIRVGTRDDAALLAELGARTFEEAFAPHNRAEDMSLYLTRSYSVRQQSYELSDPTMATLFAELDGHVAGYAQLRSGAPPSCVEGPAPLELWRFYVDRPWQGRGVAQVLMAAVRAEAARRGARTLWLCVWERNERAKAFYRKCGFLDVGSQPFILGSDRQTDRVMASPLNEATVDAAK